MTAQFDIIVPCHFGMESVLKKEIIELGYDISQVEDGRVSFHGDADAIARANIGIRTGERVLLQVGSFTATSFEELFEGIKSLEWEQYLPKNAKFWVTKAASVRSKLFSPSDIQSIVKKAIVERLKGIYRVDWFEEDGASYPIRIFIKKDVVTVGLDTTGESLHKRGYRKLTAKAPLAENLAAGLIMLSGWKSDRPLIDPFCGSGTFPIEAALIAANVAPGMKRSFTAQTWDNVVEKQIWKDNFEEAREMVIPNAEMQIFGYDLDPEMIYVSEANAKLAGMLKNIHFECRPVAELKSELSRGTIITNPPYGERLLDKEAMPLLYSQLALAYSQLADWQAHIITSYGDLEKYMGRKADKNRKLYNGMMKTYFYSYTSSKGLNPVVVEDNGQAAFVIKENAGRTDAFGKNTGRNTAPMKNRSTSGIRGNAEKRNDARQASVSGDNSRGRTPRKWTMD